MKKEKHLFPATSMYSIVLGVKTCTIFIFGAFAMKVTQGLVGVKFCQKLGICLAVGILPQYE